MFRFVATANTNGSGDETGLYQGAQRQHLAWLDRFILCEMGYPSADVEKQLMASMFPVLPDDLRCKMVDFANEVRKLFMGEYDNGNLSGAIEVTLSTRTLLRWAELTIRFQPLAHQGIQPVSYALDRALAYRASRETRAMLHELAQRIFPVRDDFVRHVSASIANDAEYIQQALQKLLGCANLASYTRLPEIHLNKTSNTPSGGKFWRCSATPDGIEITWGRWNTQGQTMPLETAQCVNNDPIQELCNRTLTKLNEGYTLDRPATFIPTEIL